MLTFGLATADRVLMTAPKLASWDAASSPSQHRLTSYLDHATGLLAPSLKATPDPLALRLEVGLAAGVDLLRERDLDNYLHPLVTHLTRETGRRFVSVSASKRHAPSSRIGLAQAEPEDSVPAASSWHVRTTASTESPAYKNQIADVVPSGSVLPPGPLTVDIVFGTGRGRSWVNLWKPTIDALGGLWGSAGIRQWHPDDGRITSLGLHHHELDDLGYDVELRIHVRADEVSDSLGVSRP